MIHDDSVTPSNLVFSAQNRNSARIARVRFAARERIFPSARVQTRLSTALDVSEEIVAEIGRRLATPKPAYARSLVPSFVRTLCISASPYMPRTRGVHACLHACARACMHACTRATDACASEAYEAGLYARGSTHRWETCRAACACDCTFTVCTRVP